MTGHRPWPPGKLHDDMQRGRKEVFRLGDWSIFAWGSSTSFMNMNWDSFVMHSVSWEQWEDIPGPVYANTGVKDKTVELPQQQHKKRKVWKHCNTNLIPHDTKSCPGCGKPIPHEVSGLWTLQNMERIQELNSV